ncbi:MAG: DUF4199 domain-containing protein [Bacteroidota bacterium]
MRNLIMKYGLIAGGIMVGLFLATHFIGDANGMSYNVAQNLGTITMIVALLTIFVGVKDYRDNLKSGKITFWNALKTGLLINAIASLIFGIYTILLFKVIDPQYGDKLKTKYVEGIKSSDMSQEQMDAAIASLNNVPEIYENVFLQGSIMFVTVFAIGIIISLISSFILKKA